MLTTRVRNFVATVSVLGSHPKLLPDLSAAVDVELERKDNVIVVPRDSVLVQRSSQAEGGDGTGTYTVQVLDGGGTRSRTVTLGAMSDHEAIVASGLEPGVTVLRHVAR
jgi:hypothetical protein